MNRMLLLSDIELIAEAAGLRTNDFSKETFFYGALYKEIVLGLAKIFCRSQGQIELTNTEYLLNENGDIKELSLLLDFKGRQVKEFVAFILKNEKLVPKDLRKKFFLSTGFNYGRGGGVLITDSQIRYYPREEFDAVGSDGSLTDEINDVNVYLKLRAFRTKLFKLLKENYVK